MPVTPAIQVGDLSFGYLDDLVLDRIGFQVAAGERLAVVGPNGAGKTTLLLHLNGLLVGRGEVRIQGLRVEKKNLGEIRRQVGFVFSDPEDQLFMPTLLQDVAFGPLNLGWTQERALARARQALEQMGLWELRDRSSHHLSDGERHRAAIATVLAMEPTVWVLDEPAVNLDPRSRRELIRVLRELPGTVVIASHDLDLVVQVCHRCLLLDAGRLVEDGAIKKVLGDAALMERHGLEVPWRLAGAAAPDRGGVDRVA